MHTNTHEHTHDMARHNMHEDTSDTPHHDTHANTNDMSHHNTHDHASDGTIARMGATTHHDTHDHVQDGPATLSASDGIGEPTFLKSECENLIMPNSNDQGVSDGSAKSLAKVVSSSFCTGDVPSHVASDVDSADFVTALSLIHI